MADCMNFPKDWAVFLEDYSFRDHKEFYTNGARLIPTFRVEQMMHHYLRKATENAVSVVRCKDCKHYCQYPKVDKPKACFVPVQGGKPLEEFLHPIDAYKGLKAKYLVFKADTGKVVDNCFILRPGKDAAAVEALRAYANATDNKTLAEDIYSWVGKGEPVQEWISVKDRLPEDWCPVLVMVRDVGKPLLGSYRENAWFHEKWNTTFINGAVTHWMPLPELPEGE